MIVRKRMTVGAVGVILVLGLLFAYERFRFKQLYAIFTAETRACLDYLTFKAHDEARSEMNARFIKLHGPSRQEAILADLRIVVEPPRIVSHRSEARELNHVFTWHKVHALNHLILENYDSVVASNFLNIVHTNGILLDSERPGIETALFVEPRL
jgi:hypothetical protein